MMIVAEVNQFTSYTQWHNVTTYNSTMQQLYTFTLVTIACIMTFSFIQCWRLVMCN